MDILIAHPLREDVLAWLKDRHSVVYDPGLQHDPERLLRLLAEARGAMLPPSQVLDEAALRGAPHLRVVGRLAGTAAEDVERPACARLGIEIVRGNAAAARSEAEFILGALLTLARPAPDDPGAVVGRELGALTVGLVGMSHTARTLASMLLGFRSRVLGYDPVIHESDPGWVQWGAEPFGLREMLEIADVVCVQLPYFSRYRGLLGDRYLPYAKPGQVWISVSTSALFDAQSLALGLTSGRLQAVWLDAVEPEDIFPGAPLHDLPGLIATPRLAGNTVEAHLRRAWLVARQMHELLRMLPEGSRDFGTSVPGELLDVTLPLEAASAGAVADAADGEAVPVMILPAGRRRPPQPQVEPSAARPQATHREPSANR